MTRTFAFLIRFCPVTPTFGMIRCLLYRATSSRSRSAAGSTSGGRGRLTEVDAGDAMRPLSSPPTTRQLLGLGPIGYRPQPPPQAARENPEEPDDRVRDRSRRPP